MVRLTIDGRAVEVPPGTTLLSAARGAGLDVPTLCHDDRLRPSGACRLCLVEIEGSGHPVSSCTTPAADGMRVQTHTPALEADRRAILSLLARQFPREAMAVDAPFQRLLRAHGLEATGAKDPSRVDDSHPYIHVDMSQCVTCFRCVRICEEVQGRFVWQAWHRGDRTRILPGTSPDLLSSPCVSCGACVDTCPTGALEDVSILKLGRPEAFTRTTCPYCGVGCEMEVGTRGGHLVTVRPAHDAPVNRGHLCVKGRYAFRFVHHPDRATRPMIREGGDWRTVSWAEAIDHVATRLTALLERHGPDAIGVLGSARATNEENYVTQKFARVVLGTHNVDCCARVCHAPSAAALGHVLGTGAATNAFADVERTGLILAVGTNATENHPVVGARIVQAALRGTPLIVVDPRRIELAEHATLHLALRPGTNVALLNAMAAVIVAEGLCDETFLAERALGVDDFRAFVAEWTPERAAEICGVDAGDVRRAARMYASVKPAMSVHGLGATEHVQGTDGVMALVNLALLTGNLGRPGAGVNPLRGQNNVQGSAHMGCEPDHLTGYATLEGGRALFESVWGQALPSTRGLNLMQMMDAASARRLHALWVVGYDILMTDADLEATRRALGALDLVIVQDLFLNETAREFGTVFFPAASSFEKDGTFMNGERRVQRVRRAVDPVGESKPDWAIFCEVARAMGRPEGFGFESAEAVWEEIRAVWPAGRGITYARLEHGGLQWPCPDEGHPGTDVLHTRAFPMGPRATLERIDFTPSPEAVDALYPFLLNTGRSLYQFNAATMTGRTDNHLLRPTDTLDIHPDDAAAMGLEGGARVRVTSRHGSCELPLRLCEALRRGELFATFQSPELRLNAITGPHRDRQTGAPEYKVTAVRLESVAAGRGAAAD